MYDKNLLIIGVLFVLQVIIFLLGAELSLKNSVISGTEGKLPLIVKIYISFSLMFGAFFILWTNTSEKTYIYSLFVFIGMIVSSIGDLIMAKVIRVKKRLVGGMIFFALAHGFYIAAYIKTMQQYNVFNKKYITIGMIIFIAFCLIERLVLIRKSHAGIVTNLAVNLYGSLIVLMAFFAFLLSYTIGGKWWITFIGALFFIFSDSIIAVHEILRIKIKNAGIWIWLTYMAGQMCIIYTAILPF
jgi:hypothetical protein